jgi:endoglucanase
VPLYNNWDNEAVAASTGFGPAARKVKIIAEAPQAEWFGEWNPTATVATKVAAYVSGAARVPAMPVLVMYAIPHRDCGSYSGGGFADAGQYAAWIRQVARGIDGRRAAVVLEPDSLGLTDCLSTAQLTSRYAVLRDAVGVLSANANTAVYIDGGHSRWLTPAEDARRLKLAGVARARGFSLNVSQFLYTAEELAYGERVSALLGGKHYVVDTSRNGKGPGTINAMSWCNPSGRGLGVWPGSKTGAPHADAYLWVKSPGLSDGTCHPGDPKSGEWFEAAAVDLVTTAGL